MDDVITVDSPPEGTICDFCSRPMRPGEMEIFPCPDFTMRSIRRGDSLIFEQCHCHAAIDILPTDSIVDFNRLGGWGACAVCAAAIHQEDHDALFEACRVAMDAVYGPGSSNNPVMGAMMACSLDGFWAHREGGELHGNGH